MNANSPRHSETDITYAVVDVMAWIDGRAPGAFSLIEEKWGRVVLRAALRRIAFRRIVQDQGGRVERELGPIPLCPRCESDDIDLPSAGVLGHCRTCNKDFLQGKEKHKQGE